MLTLQRSFALLRLTLALGLASVSGHADSTPLTAKESDPQTLG